MTVVGFKKFIDVAGKLLFPHSGKKKSNLDLHKDGGKNTV
jgi:hypothetical protein